MPPTSTGRRRAAYHHGDLPSALVDAALELVAEKGTRGFTVAEAARRTNVSASAPYRHFEDRDALLAATAVRAYGELLARFHSAIEGAEGPSEQLAAIAAAYVCFAAERRAMFEVLFGAGLEKARYKELEEAAGEVVATVSGVAAKLAPDGDEELTWVLVQSLAGVAHGHAAMMLDGAFGDPADAVAVAEQRAAAATRALVRGRSLLFAAA